MVIKKILSAAVTAAIAAQMLGMGIMTSNYSPSLTAYADDSNVEYSEDFENYIIESMADLPKEIDVLDYAAEFDYDVSKLCKAFLTIRDCNPSLFFVKKKVKSSYRTRNGKYTSFKLSGFNYTGSKKEIDNQRKELDEAVEKALQYVTDDMKPLEKALAIHDYLILNTQYDTNFFKGVPMDQLKGTAYDCLVDGVAVCEGYSAAYMYILNKLGIECEMLTSSAMKHAWNYVKIGKEWYHVDVTHDDPLMNNKYDNLGKVSHENFLLSDKAIKKTKHYGWTTKGLPAATSTTYDDYFWQDVSAGMFNVDGLWYYVVQDPNTSGMDMVTNLKTFDYEKKKTKTVANIPSTWLVWNKSNSFWTDSYVRLAEADGKLYYNTLDTIYCYSPETNESEEYYKPSTEKGYIYGIHINEDQLSYSIKTAADKKDNIDTKSMTE